MCSGSLLIIERARGWQGLFSVGMTQGRPFGATTAVVSPPPTAKLTICGRDMDNNGEGW